MEEILADASTNPIPDELVEVKDNTVYLAQQKVNEGVYNHINTMDEWFTAIRATDSPVLKFALLFRIPVVWKTKEHVDPKLLSEIIRECPVGVISDLVLSDNNPPESIMTFAQTFLEMAFSVPDTDFSRFMELQVALIYVLNNRQLEKTVFYSILNSCIRIGVHGFLADDAVRVLNTTVAHLLEETNEFPAIETLRCVQQLLERLNPIPERAMMLSINLPWPKNLEKLICHFFRTFKIDESYITISFELASSMIQIVGFKHVYHDSRFPLLLCSLAAGRLRIVMEDPLNIVAGSLVPPLTILTFYMNDIDEEDSSINEQDSVAMIKHIRDAGEYLMQFFIDCAKQSLSIPEAASTAMYVYICHFLVKDGMEMLNAKKMNPVVSEMLKLGNNFLTSDQSSIAEMLLYNLPAFDKLPVETLDFIMAYFTFFSKKKDAESRNHGWNHVAITLKHLQNSRHRDFFTADSLELAIKTVKDCGVDDIVNLLISFR